MTYYREFDRSKGWYGFFVGRMRQSGKRQFIHMVKLLCGQRHSRTVLDDYGLGMLLHHRSAPDGVLVLVMEYERFSIHSLVLRNLHEGRQFNIPLMFHRAPFLQFQFNDRARDIGEVSYFLTFREPARDFNHLPLPHAEHQHICRRIGQDGLPY